MQGTGANGELSRYRCARGLFKSGKTCCRQKGLIYQAAVTEVRSFSGELIKRRVAKLLPVPRIVTLP